MSVIDSATVENKERQKVCAVAAGLLDVVIDSARRIGGSGNNRVYHLQGDHAQQYAAKFYFRHVNDKRDRLEIEYNSLSFLSSQGITNVPRPLAVSRKESCAIYEFIEGEKIPAPDITMADIPYAEDFLGRLKRLNHAARSYPIADASDACFSISAIVAGIEGRLVRLTKIKTKEQEYEELQSFLQEDFKPFLSVLTRWAHQQCAQKHISFDSEISWEERTLSPSDFGFHNAIRGGDGRIVFLDFEYFGWDDPSKMIVDFLLHPAMALSESMRKYFVRGMLDVFKENKGLIDRIAVVYPLHGLKWCAIFLNEFIPNDFSRRSFAAANPLDASQVRRQQLLKAKDLCSKIKATYENFPYATG